MHVEVSHDGGTAWTKIENKEEVESRLIGINVEQFSHAGNTPCGYTALGKEIGHTGDSDMAESILNGTLEHKCMDKDAGSYCTLGSDPTLYLYVIQCAV
jgi:hypothetical protein